MKRSDRRRLATVLFTDIVGSTTIAEELGDRRWRELVTRHNRILRTQIRSFHGHEHDTAGDGFFASFETPADAIRCACTAAEAVQELGVDIRSGVHFGETEVVDHKLGGIGVITGSRVSALAGPAQVLTTFTTRELVTGAGFSFRDRGAHQLKGIEGEQHIFAVTGRDLPTPLDPRKLPVDAARSNHPRSSNDARATPLSPDSSRLRRSPLSLLLSPARPPASWLHGLPRTPSSRWTPRPASP